MSLIEQIDPEKEIQCILSYLADTWHIPKELSSHDLATMVTEAFNLGIDVGKDRCGNGDLASLLLHTIMKRETLLGKDPDEKFVSIDDLLQKLKRKEKIDKPKYNILKHDGWIYLLETFARGRDELEHKALEVSINYSEVCELLMEEFEKSYNPSGLHPLPYGEHQKIAYSELLSYFTDKDNMGYFDKLDCGRTQQNIEMSMFQGHDISTSTRSFIFTEQITLHTVLQYDKNYNELPWQKLMKTLVSHGLMIAEINNTHEAYNIIKQLEFPDEFHPDLPQIEMNDFLKKCFRAGYRRNFPPEN